MGQEGGVHLSRIFSEEWFKSFCEMVNMDRRYNSDGKGWMWDVDFLIRGDERSTAMKSGLNVRARLKLRDGRCNGVEIVHGEEAKGDGYVIEGKASTWEGVMEGKMTIINAILKGDLAVTGNVRKLTEYVLAANDLVRIAGMVK